MQALRWYLILFFLIGGLICAVSSFITTARVARLWVDLESKIHRYVSNLTGDDELRICEDRIRPRLERWYSGSMLVLRAFTAIAYGVLVVSGRFSSGKYGGEANCHCS
jgi:hypothetical protein